MKTLSNRALFALLLGAGVPLLSPPVRADGDRDHGARVRGTAVVEVIEDPSQVVDIISRLKSRAETETQHPQPAQREPKTPPANLERPSLPQARPENLPMERPADRRGEEKRDRKADAERRRERAHDRESRPDRHR